MPILVALVRLDGSDFNDNKGAERLQRAHASVVRALSSIPARAEAAQDKRCGSDTLAMLKRLLDHWLSRASGKAGAARLGYEDERDGVTKGLLSQPGLGPRDLFTCLNSLRDVEPGVGLILGTGEIDTQDVGAPDAAGSEEVRP